MTQAQNTRESFTLVGKASFKPENLVKDNAFASGWTKRRLSFAVAVSNSNRPFVELEFGFYPEGHAKFKPKTIINSFKQNESTKKWEKFAVPYAKRFDKEITDQVVRARKIEIALVADLDVEGNVIGTTDNMVFLTEQDAIAYVQANLKPDTRIAVYGETKYSRYLSKTNEIVVKKEKVIKQIRIAKTAENNDSAGSTSFYIDEDSFDKSTFKDDKKYRINGFHSSYVEKDAEGNAVNDIIPMEYLIDCSAINFDDPSHVARVEFLTDVFTDTKRKTIYKTTWRYKIFEGNEQKEVTVKELSDNLQKMITLGFISEEEALRKAAGGSYGDRVSELKLIMPTGIEAKEIMEDLTAEDLESLPLENKTSKVVAAAVAAEPKPEVKAAAQNEFDDFFGGQ